MADHNAEQAGPTCRSCYVATLRPDERARFYAELVTSPVYLCPPHQARIDAALARVGPVLIDRTTPPASPPLDDHGFWGATGGSDV